ncbi:MAG: hypothetical protein VX246_02895 [Myxococcota bacterium]|nr:hypothetical protein [Myxococcota bacterium]
MRVATEKERRETARRRRAQVRRGQRRLRNGLLGSLALFAILLAAAVGVGGSAAVEANAREWLSALGNYARAQLAAAPVDSLRIDIKFKHLHRLHTKRDAAQLDGWLVPRDDDFVPGSVAIAGVDVPVRLRLLGPEIDFVDGDMWSLEIHVDGDAHVNGMRHFALYPPAVVDGSTPLVAAEHFRRIGLTSPRTSLVEVALNGDRLGQAIVIELPSDELLRARGRRTAPIVHLDSGPYWSALAANGEAGPYDNPYTASVIASGKARRNNGDTATAIGLFRAFLDGTLSASQVFVLDETARWLATAEFWGEGNALHWTRTHFYLDAATVRLAPIPSLPGVRAPSRPAHSAEPGELISPRSALGARLLADPEMRHRFARELVALADSMKATAPPTSGDHENAVEVLLMTLQRQEIWALERLHLESPFSKPIDFSTLVARATSLGKIDPKRSTWFDANVARSDFEFSRVVSAYARIDDEGPFLDLLNLLPMPVMVATLRHDEAGTPGAPVTLASRIRFPIALPATPHGATPTPVRVRYRQPNAATISNEIRGVARIAGEMEEYPFLARRSLDPLLEHPVPTASLDEVLATHEFLHRVPGDLALHTRPGRYDVAGSLVMPAGMSLVIEAGTELTFEARAALIATGPLDLRGTEKAPVVLRGTAGRKGPRWQGVALLRATRPSHWTHAQILDGTGIDRRGWHLPAAVTVRDASIELNHVEIKASRANQALALVDSRVAANDLQIVDSTGTALWLKGSQAEFSDLSVAGSGRIGLRAVGSRVSLRGGSLRQIRATALEAAETSQVDARDLDIADVSIAASAKSGARLLLDNSRIERAAHIPLLAFTDLAELGGGEIVATRNSISADRKALAQRGSTILIDGTPAEVVDAEIGDLRID